MEKAQATIQERPTLMEAFKHSIIFLVLITIGVSIWYSYQTSIDPFFTKVVVGKIAAVLFFAIAGFSYFTQEKLYQKTSKWRRVMSWMLLLSTLPIALAPVDEIIRFIKNEKVEMLVIEEGGKTYLKHSILGFSLLHPGEGYTLEMEDPKIQELKNSAEKDTMGQMSAEIYPYAKQGEGALVITVLRMNEEVTQPMLSELYQGLLTKIKADTDTTENDGIVWQEDKKEGLIHASVKEGSATIRLLPRGENIVMLQAFTKEPKALDELILSYKP
jgi:hypothetical protein